MARRLRLPAQLRGADALRRPLPLARPLPRPRPAAPGAARPGGARPLRPRPRARPSASSSATPTSTTRVDAPAIARRFGCKAYGSRSLVNLMALHGLAERTVEVEPYRTYELGPFEVSFTPSVHSKLLLGLAVPYDGELSCEHLDSLSPGAYRCGQVWGISIAVAGLALLPPGQRQPRRRGGPRARRRRLPRRRRRPQLHRRLLAADPAAARTARRRPHPLRQLLPPARRGDGVRRQRPARASCRRRSAPSAATSRSRRCRARIPSAPSFGRYADKCRRTYLAAICSIVPIVRGVPVPRAASIAFRSRSDSQMPPLGSQ